MAAGRSATSAPSTTRPRGTSHWTTRRARFSPAAVRWWCGPTSASGRRPRPRPISSTTSTPPYPARPTTRSTSTARPRSTRSRRRPWRCPRAGLWPPGRTTPRAWAASSPGGWGAAPPPPGGHGAWTAAPARARTPGSRPWRCPDRAWWRRGRTSAPAHRRSGSPPGRSRRCADGSLLRLPPGATTVRRGMNGGWPEHDALIADLTRRSFLTRAGGLGLGALVLSAVPVAERMLAAQPALAQPSLPDATLQAFADTMIPGRKATKTDLGNEIHPQAIAGVDKLPGAVEADALALYHHPLTGFDALAPALQADLAARSLAQGGTFLTLGFDRRGPRAQGGAPFGNPHPPPW